MLLVPAAMKRASLAGWSALVVSDVVEPLVRLASRRWTGQQTPLPRTNPPLKMD